MFNRQILFTAALLRYLWTKLIIVILFWIMILDRLCEERGGTNILVDNNNARVSFLILIWITSNIIINKNKDDKLMTQ